MEVGFWSVVSKLIFDTSETRDAASSSRLTQRSAQSDAGLLGCWAGGNPNDSWARRRPLPLGKAGVGEPGFGERESSWARKA